MPDRLEVTKTYKLYIDGAFPRSESGRSTPVLGRAPRKGAEPPVLAHVSKASRKDLRDAVEAARRAQPKWQDATAYLRGQILYRVAEMLEGKRDEFADALERVASGAAGPAVPAGSSRPSKSARAANAKSSRPLSPRDEVSRSIDRIVCFAGWSDKFSQMVGCQNPVSGPFYNFTIPEATGVVCVVAPSSPALLGLVSLLAPVIVSGNAAVVLGSEANPIVPAILGEVFATSDLPPGVVNMLTGERAELLPQIASHRDVDAIHAAGVNADEATLLRTGMAENLKRVVISGGSPRAPHAWDDDQYWHAPQRIEAFVEFKTIWHPSAV